MLFTRFIREENHAGYLFTVLEVICEWSINSVLHDNGIWIWLIWKPYLNCNLQNTLRMKCLGYVWNSLTNVETKGTIFFVANANGKWNSCN